MNLPWNSNPVAGNAPILCRCGMCLVTYICEYLITSSYEPDNYCSEIWAFFVIHMIWKEISARSRSIQFLSNRACCFFPACMTIRVQGKARVSLRRLNSGECVLLGMVHHDSRNSEGTWICYSCHSAILLPKNDGFCFLKRGNCHRRGQLCCHSFFTVAILHWLICPMQSVINQNIIYYCYVGCLWIQ